MAMERTIAPILDHDLPAVALVHTRAFLDSALTRLGPEAVRRYYEWQLHGPHEHHCIGVFQQDCLVGFAVGGIARGALAGFVKKNKWFLLGQIFRKPGLVFSGRGRRAIVSAFLALRRFRKPSKVPLPEKLERPKSFGILAIAVDPVCQGKGVGLQLMEHLERIARNHHFPRMHLSVNVKNIQAIRFYEKLSWVRGGANPVWNGFMEKHLS